MGRVPPLVTRPAIALWGWRGQLEGCPDIKRGRAASYLVVKRWPQNARPGVVSAVLCPFCGERGEANLFIFDVGSVVARRGCLQCNVNARRAIF